LAEVDIDSKRGMFSTRRFAKAHAVFERFWALKSQILGRASEAIASSNGESDTISVANAHAVFAKS